MMYLLRALRLEGGVGVDGTLTLFCLELSEGTRLLEFQPIVAHRIVAACNKLCRELIAESGGEIHSELSFENSMLVAFPFATSCIEAASAIHRFLIREKWVTAKNVLRSAIMTGEIHDVDSNDDFLRSLRALADIARPGQILVAQAARVIARRGLSEGHGFFDLGLHHLDDGSRSQSLYQLLHPELPSDFQPLPSQLTAASNLPSGGSPFVGRRKEIEEVKAGFFSKKVVCLVGFGGVGKSRLALEVAREMLEDHHDGASYADISGAESAHDVYLGLGSALGVHEGQELPLDHSVLQKLRPLEILLVLDNADSAADCLGPILTRITDHCLQVQVLLTARRQLDLPIVHHYRVAPLDAPGDEYPAWAGELSRLDSVALFLRRACAIHEDFELNDQNARLIAAICSKLEGIPLAIELAAAQMRHMSLSRIAANLEDRFALLVKEGAGRGESALETAIRWSFDGFSRKHQQILMRLCAFAGAFTLESAVKVVAWGRISESEARGMLIDLVEQGYLAQSAHCGTIYLRMLDTIREFGQSLVVEKGLSVGHMNRHADYFAQHATELKDRIYGEDQVSIVNEIHRTYRNYLVALDWSIGPEGGDRAERLVRALYIYWFNKCMFREGVRWAEDTLQNAVLDRPGTCKLHVIAGTLAGAGGHYFVADDHYQKAIRIASKLGDLSLLRMCYGSSGTNLGLAGESRRGIRALEKALEICIKLKDEMDIADMKNNLALIQVDINMHEAARRHLHESLETNTKLNRNYGLACNNFLLGRSHRMTGEFEEATSALELAFEHYNVAEDGRGLSATVREFAFLRIATGIFHPAAILLGADEAIRLSGNIQVSAVRSLEIERARSLLRATLGPHYLVEWQKGLEMSQAQVREFLLIGQGPSILS